MSRIVLNNLTYSRPDGHTLFNNLNISFENRRYGITGRNGSGKTTLIKLITGELTPVTGTIQNTGKLAVLPQAREITSYGKVHELFSSSEKYLALKRILSGSVDPSDYETLGDDWEVESRIEKYLDQTGTGYISPDRDYDTLSGGEKTKVLLASLLHSGPDFIIMDEPTNHLDRASRMVLYEFAEEYDKGLIVISHDRDLLRRMDVVCEISDARIKLYGGNYDFYREQRAIEKSAALERLEEAERSLKKSVALQERTLRNQEKRMGRADKKAKEGGIPKVIRNSRRNSGENTFGKITNSHLVKTEREKEKLAAARAGIGREYKISADFTDRRMPEGKIIFRAEQINFAYDGLNNLWQQDLSFELRGNGRLLISGSNGSGKSTLLHLIGMELQPKTGEITRCSSNIFILDQAVRFLAKNDTLLGNMKRFSGGKIPEHEMRIRLGRFLFYGDDVFKKVSVLSGGERVKAGLACLLASDPQPDLILLDEPTNNLDLESIEIITAGLNEYKGPLVVVSHDPDFAAELKVTRELVL